MGCGAAVLLIGVLVFRWIAPCRAKADDSALESVIIANTPPKKLRPDYTKRQLGGGTINIAARADADDGILVSLCDRHLKHNLGLV